MAKIIAIANQKGGVGKTTTTVNLAAALTLHNKKILLLDMDPQGNATSGLGLDKRSISNSIYGVITQRIDISEAIRPTEVEGLSIVSAHVDLAGAEIEIVPVKEREYILKNALSSIRDDFDYILMDCPPSLGLLTINAFTAADSVMIPVQCEFFALEGLGQLLNSIKLVKKQLNPELDVEGVVCTMFDPRTNLSAQVYEEVKKFFTSKVFNSVIPRNVKLGEAPSFGMAIEQYDSKCAGAVSYRELADELIKRNEGTL